MQNEMKRRRDNKKRQMKYDCTLYTKHIDSLYCSILWLCVGYGGKNTFYECICTRFFSCSLVEWHPIESLYIRKITAQSIPTRTHSHAHARSLTKINKLSIRLVHPFIHVCFLVCVGYIYSMYSVMCTVSRTTDK